ncbi:MAG: hypothetical protein A2289_04725 [Deltaproteobacteria bacterium RIFOXYA12_FULL_58_15]|nr:MAG: hypothetical protein A2289_04725 [Deltaproteobacteria bacterium RIFOXYA12_FULL_58_15]OGR09890.1 MAG: hypothetical protein A2341_27235 [Deltaproteobacteria bacterium RIFOXYB12_FULL_58_9]
MVAAAGVADPGPGLAGCEVVPEQPTSSTKERIEFRLIMAAPYLPRAYDQVQPQPSFVGTATAIHLLCLHAYSSEAG